MKNIKGKSILVALVISGTLLAMSSCKESNSPKNQDDKKKDYSEMLRDLTSADLRDAENPNNPYDDFGKQHFNGIVYVFKDLKGSVTEPFTTIYKSSLSYERSLSYDSKFRATAVQPITEAEVQDLYQSVRTDFTFKTKENISTEAKNELKNFSKVFMQLMKEEESEQNYKTIKELVVKYESEILNNKILTEEEKALILQATSTSRYSALQWEKPISKIASKIETGELQTKSGLKWYHWLYVVGADIAGAVFDRTISSTVAASKFAYDIIEKELKMHDATKDRNKDPNNNNSNTIGGSQDNGNENDNPNPTPNN